MNETVVKAENHQANAFTGLLILGALFFIFGFVTWLNGALIPFLQIACELTHMQAYLVTMFFYIAYTVMALPVSSVIRKIGYKNAMSAGLLVMAIGALLFLPAAYTRMYSVFLLGLFFLGSGLTLLQTASNPYVVLLGPPETAAVRISFMGILNKAAGVIAPIVFTTLVLNDMSGFSEEALAALTEQQRAVQLDELSSRLSLPYLFMALALAALAGFLKLSPLTEPNNGNEQSGEQEEVAVKGIINFPNLILGAVALFFYVGVEVVAGDTIGLFGKDLGVEKFGQLTAYTMSFMVLGYILGMLLIPKLLSQESALKYSAILGIALSILILFSDDNSYFIFGLFNSGASIGAIPDVIFMIALLGLANAIVWPAIWPLALQDLGKYTSIGAALLIMGISGGAIIPFIYGAIADISGNSQQAYWILIPCYLFILFYAIKGHKIRSWS